MSRPAQEGGFVGRAAELGLLAREYERDESAFCPIYGRRRIGKSELILHFLRDKPAIYYVGKAAPAALQMREFLEQAARVLEEPLLAVMPTTSWRSIFEEVTKRRGDKKLVIALDEFQWLAGASPELPSILQELWDRQWRGARGIMLILCGSYVGFMEREVLGKKSPLFGRRTSQIKLGPFGHREAEAFHRGWSLTDQAMAYFVCGGIPLYLRLFDRKRSVEANIESVILDDFGPLFREPDFLLREELREVESYQAVLLAVAEGRSTMNDIAERSGVAQRSLPYFLQQLIELGYVSRRYPLGDSRPTARSVRFVLDDPLLRFWFRFVFPNLSFLQQMGPVRTMRERIRPALPAYFGGCFERLCRDSLPRLYEREGVSAAFEIGEYWNKSVQIDLVGRRSDNWTDLGECKWGHVRSVGAVLAELEAKAVAYPNTRNATIGLRLFLNQDKKVAKSSTHNDRPLRIHDLSDLYA